MMLLSRSQPDNLLLCSRGWPPGTWWPPLAAASSGLRWLPKSP